TDAIADLQTKVARFAKTVDAEGKARAITELEERMGSPGFWDDPGKAQGVVQQLKGLKAVVEPYTVLARQSGDLMDLAEMAEADKDEGTLGEVRGELAKLESD